MARVRITWVVELDVIKAEQETVESAFALYANGTISMYDREVSFTWKEIAE